MCLQTLPMTDQNSFRADTTMNETNNQKTQSGSTCQRNGFTLPLVRTESIGKNGKPGKVFYVPDFSELLVVDIDKKADGVETRCENIAETGATWAAWLADTTDANNTKHTVHDILVAYAGAEIRTILYHAQCIAPETRKDSTGPLNDAGKIKRAQEIVATLHELETRASAKSPIELITAKLAKAAKEGNFALQATLLQELIAAAAKQQADMSAAS